MIMIWSDWWLKFKFWREKKLLGELHRILNLYSFILIIWGFYRLLFRLPEWLEEFFIKPLVFLLPVIWVMKKEGLKWSEIGLRRENWFKSAAWGVLGGLFFSFINLVGLFLATPEVLVKPLGMNILALGYFLMLSLAAALWEQLVFSGYILHQLLDYWKDEAKAIGLTMVLFALIHLPMLLIYSKVSLTEAISQLIVLLIVGMGNGYLMVKQKNLSGPVIAEAILLLTWFMFR